MRARFFPVMLALGAGLLGACHDATGVDDNTASAAGIYLLQQPRVAIDYAPTSGSMHLSRTGHIERTATYPLSTGGTKDIVMTGSFRATGNRVELRLTEVRDGASYVWGPTGTLDGSALTLRYPGPADGEITETYHRVTTLVP